LQHIVKLICLVIKSGNVGQIWWFRPIILATGDNEDRGLRPTQGKSVPNPISTNACLSSQVFRKAHIGGSWYPGWPRYKARPFLKKKKKRKEKKGKKVFLHSKYKALSSNHQYHKKKKKMLYLGLIFFLKQEI
jgi:hypothetical protein